MRTHATGECVLFPETQRMFSTTDPSTPLLSSSRRASARGHQRVGDTARVHQPMFPRRCRDPVKADPGLLGRNCVRALCSDKTGMRSDETRRTTSRSIAERARNDQAPSTALACNKLKSNESGRRRCFRAQGKCKGHANRVLYIVYMYIARRYVTRGVCCAVRLDIY